MKELNILKFYGILLVVLGHVVFTYSSMSIITPNVPSPILNFVKEVIYAFHMPLFIFSSGCIFAWQLEVKRKSITFMSLFKNKAKRLMIPFFVFGLLMVYPTMVLLGFRDPVHYFINGFILALDPRHLMVCISTVSDIPCVLLFTQNLHQTEYPNMGDSHSRFPSLLFPHKYDLFPNQKCGTISHLVHIRLSVYHLQAGIQICSYRSRMWNWL